MTSCKSTACTAYCACDEPTVTDTVAQLQLQCFTSRIIHEGTIQGEKNAMLSKEDPAADLVAM